MLRICTEQEIVHELIKKLESQYPNISFQSGDKFYWSPKDQIVYYIDKLKKKNAKYALFHEVGHALLDHKYYKKDFDLLRMEVSAWNEAKKIATTFEQKIDEDHVQDCLDTYRDWLYRRSKCPSCSVVSLQNSESNNYTCFNCNSSWQVTSSKFCRPYRTLVR